eukprot:3334434-Prymnesium_polylepis.1
MRSARHAPRCGSRGWASPTRRKQRLRRPKAGGRSSASWTDVAHGGPTSPGCVDEVSLADGRCCGRWPMLSPKA